MEIVALDYFISVTRNIVCKHSNIFQSVLHEVKLDTFMRPYFFW